MPEPNPSPVPPNRRARRARRGRVATAAGLAAITAVSARYANAAFQGGTPTSGRSVSQSAAATGDVHVSPTNGDGANQAFMVGVTGLYPGLSPGKQRAIDLTISGTVKLKTLTMYVDNDCTGCSSGVLDAAGNLQLEIEVCSVAWTGSGTSPNRGYTCADNLATPNKGTVVLAATDMHSIKNSTAFSTMNGATNITTGMNLNVNAVNHVLLTFSLPTSASNNSQGTSSVYGFRFGGTSRDGTTA